MKETLVLGLGNPLMADDGAGVQLIELLRRECLPTGVDIQDGGTAGLGLVPEMEGYQRLILLDCAQMGLEPGQWRRFTLEEADLLAGDQGELSLHHSSLRDALLLAEALDTLPPEVIIYGIEPASVEWDRPMSREVATALPRIVQAVLNEVSQTTSKRGKQHGKNSHH